MHNEYIFINVEIMQIDTCTDFYSLVHDISLD